MLSAGPPTVTGVFVGGTEWSSAFYDFLNTGDGPDYGFQIPTGSTTQTKSLPWFNIDKITIRFSEDVNVKVGDLSVSGVSATAFPFEHFFYDAAAHVATWTLAAPLTKNSYQLDLNGNGLDPVADLDNNVLDGEWLNNSDTFPSGNGTAGGDFAFNFKVMPGDVNRNAAVESMDVTAVNSRLGSSAASSNYNEFADVDGSGAIGSDDAQDVQSKIWSTYPSQAPVGVSNDAPSTLGGGALDLTDAADLAISLFADFQDAETPDNQLVFQIIENTNPQILDVATINSTTGVLNFSASSGASGRTFVTVKATDSGGLSTTATYILDVNYVNQPPIFEEFDIQLKDGSNDTFEVSGYVSYDDGPVEGLIVHFSGAYTGRATVLADGTFLFAIVLTQEQWGQVFAYVEDAQGGVSIERVQPAEVA